LFLKSSPLPQKRPEINRSALDGAPLVLASTSPYRRELLARLGIPFECLPPQVDETPVPGETGVALVARLARAKARAVARQRPEAWVIGSDQVALMPDTGKEQILGKPGSASRCREQLLACSARTVSFVTGVAVVHRDALDEFVDTTEVCFRALDAATVERYVAAEQPFDCAGGFKSEGLGITLCAAIKSEDPTALIGLPLIRLCAVLRMRGFELP
jgi:septum formation protein